VKGIIKAGFLLVAALISTTVLTAGDKDKEQPKKTGTEVVDSGSFGIFMGGKRIGTETFKIEQRSDVSVATAEIKVDDGTTKAVQSAELQITPKGDLHSYVWHASVPVKEESSVEPNDQLITEHVLPVDLKRHDVPHVLPLSTMILDDNFFSHREILLWRYLATCVTKDGRLMCGPTTFSILVPRQHQAASATLELIGADKVSIKGTMRELNKVALRVGDPQRLVVMNQRDAEAGQWLLWVDNDYKILKMTVAGTNIEIVRD
jgi:hypothetical protein